MRFSKKLAVLAILIAVAGCASQHSGRRSLKDDVEKLGHNVERDVHEIAGDVKKAAKNEADAIKRFSKGAIPDSEMLKDRSIQEYRDNVVP